MQRARSEQRRHPFVITGNQALNAPGGTALVCLTLLPDVAAAHLESLYGKEG